MLSFADIFGQDEALAAIRSAWRADRLPHGLIFAGPVGVGKSLTARALAGVFLCDKPQGDAPCGTCESCRVMAAGNHPDFHVIYKELIRILRDDDKLKPVDIPVEVIRRELIDKANLKSGMGRGKVFIIEQAELLNAAGQNSMLKTLEEPAGRTLIILITDQPDALLPTIRSRCRTIRFAALDEQLVQKELSRRGVSADVAADAARFSEGSLGLALKLIEDGVIDPARQLLFMVRGLLAGQPAEDLRTWFTGAAEAYADKQLARDKNASQNQATRDGMILYLRLMAQEFRRQLRATTDADQLERICQVIDSAAQAEKYLDANVTIPLIFQQLAMKLSPGA